MVGFGSWKFGNANNGRLHARRGKSPLSRISTSPSRARGKESDTANCSDERRRWITARALCIVSNRTRSCRSPRFTLARLVLSAAHQRANA